MVGDGEATDCMRTLACGIPCESDGWTKPQEVGHDGGFESKIRETGSPRVGFGLVVQLNPSWHMVGNHVLEEQPILQTLEIDARTSRFLFEPRDGRVAS